MKTLITLAALAALTLSTLVAQQNTTAPAKAEPSFTSSTSVKPFKRVVEKAKPDGTVVIQITLGELADADASFAKLTSIEIPLPTPEKRIAFRRNIAAVKQELSFFHEERIDLRKKYYKVIDGKLVVPPENVETVDAKWKALTQTVVRVTITPIPISLLGESAKLSMIDLVNLEGFLQE